jgi:hypothetical protein
VRLPIIFSISPTSLFSELASRIPERIVSLTLGVTTAGGYPWTNLPSVRPRALAAGNPLVNALDFSGRASSLLPRLCTLCPPGLPAEIHPRIMTLKDKDQIISIVLEMVFPVAWLNAQVEDGRTNREVQREVRLILRHIITLSSLTSSM